MADSSAATESAALTATTTTATTQAAVPPVAAQQKLSESDDFTDNSAENTKEANQEDTSQQSGLATVESEYDTASDSPSDGEEGQVVEESGVDEGEEDDSEEEEEDGDEEGTEEDDDDDEGSDEGDDDVVEVLDYERQSGDGQEQDVESRRKVDDDEDRSNPQYIPKKGTFYEHDDRTAETDPDDRGVLDGDDQLGGRLKRDDELDDGGGGGGGGGDHHSAGGSGSGGGASGAIGGGGGGGGAGGYSVGERRGSEKGGAGALKGRKKWQASTDRWTHDRFDESEQAPKSRAELVSAYGYDIRSEDGPPKARRKRRYARGPNQYTRNWEDEDAYQKSSNVEHQRHKKVPRPEEFPELGPKSSAGGGARGPAGAGRTGRVGQKNATPRQGELGVAGRTGRPGVRAERVRSGDWTADPRDRDRDQADHEYGAPVEYGSGGEGLRYRNEEQRPNARNSYHNNKENKQGGVRNGGKEKDGYGKVINSLQFKNQTRIKPPEGAQGPGAASGVDGAARGGPPVLHSNSAGALSGSSNSNKMNNSGPTPPTTGNGSNASIDRAEPQAARASVSTSASLGSVPSSGAVQHYGHVPSIVQMQQPPLQHQQQQPVQQSSQSSHSQSLKSQGYHEEDHPQYGGMYGGAGLDHDAGPVRMQSKERQLLVSAVSAGANVVPLASAPSGAHNQRSQVSPRAIVAQTSPTVPQQQPPQPITMQMQYQQQPPGVAYGVTPQGPIPTHSLQQLQHQQQQQQQQLLTSEPVVNRSKRYSSQRQRSQLENMNLAMQQSSLHDHQQAQAQQQQQLLQHQQMLQHQHQQEQMQQNKHKQSYQQQPPQQQQQQPQPQPIPPQALPQSAAVGGAGGLPMTLQQTGDYHLQQTAVAPKPQPPPQPAGPPPPPQYHQAPAVYYTSAAPTNVPPGPGDYVTTGPPVAGPPPPQVQAPPPQPQPQYVPPPYATQGPPSQGGYLAGPPVAPPASAYLPPPPQASPQAVVGPPQAPPGGPVPSYVPALGPPPPTAPVNSGQYPATAYASFQPGYNPAVVPQGVVTGAPPPPVVAPGATGPPPPAALYQPAGGITYYAPQTQAQAPRPLPTGRRPTAAIPILAPPDRKPVPAPAPGQSKAPNAASVASNRTDGGDGGIESAAPGGGEADSGENIDHILDNMFVQRPPYQPPSRKSPSPALQPSVAAAAGAAPGSGAPPSMMGTEGNANGATELRHDPEADKNLMDGGGGGGTTQELVDTIGDSVQKLSLQDEKLSHGASLADGNNETSASAVTGVSDAVGSHAADD